ncbi:CHAT domain-containing protein [Russula compacta]|nr:CHAT domain-containing protein [Russula compacta]
MTDTQSSLFEIDNDISLFQNRFLTLHRPHLWLSKCLSILAYARLTRYEVSDEREDLDKSIYHSTAAILLPFRTPIEFGSSVIEALFYLAKALLLRSRELKQPGDMKHAITYLRYLEDQSLETSDVTRNVIKASWVEVLAVQVKLGSVDPIRDIGEMVTLCNELLKSGVEKSELFLYNAVKALVDAIHMTHVPYGQPPLDGTIECLREARIRLPDWEQVRFTLAYSLYVRFGWARSHDDYEEAMSILDEIIADRNNDVKRARSLAGTLAYSRFIRDSKPEHLAEAMLRTRTYLNAMSSDDPERRTVMEPIMKRRLAHLEQTRFEQFGVKSGRQEDNAELVDDLHLAASPPMAKSNLVEFPLPMPDDSDPVPHLHALGAILNITDRTNIEKGIEYCRLCLTIPHFHLPRTLYVLGHLLYVVFDLTGNIDTLQESITVYRDVIKMPGPIKLHDIAVRLIHCLLSRLELSEDRRDSDEIMESFTMAVTDTRTLVPSRFRTSYHWSKVARYFRHPSTLTAYETAISLMQESLSFAPTLAIQHFRLVAIRDEYEKLPLDYASYLVQVGQLEQAIETLERGRGLLWSEMRGLRASIDQLSAVYLPLAEKFAAVNQDLEAVTISVSPMVWVEDGPAGDREGMDPVSGLFLIPPSFDTLRSAARGGPVILINHSIWRSDIIILLHDSPPSLIPTSVDFYDHAKRLHDKLLTARNIGLDSGEYEDALEEVLNHLYHLVCRPVIERLRELKIPEQSRVWWCPTSVFFSLPLHAMGPIPSNGPTKQYFSDIYISSYTPTLSALIESREPSMQPLDVPSMLLVVQPDDDMPRSLEEMRIVQAVCPSVETLSEKMTTPIVTLDCLRKHQFAPISCHGVLETGKPFDAFFELYEGAHLTLLDMVRSQLPSAEFAFLSACHTAEITEESIANEGLHLAAAVQYSGFRSVVGTMWAVADIDGPVVARSFYKSVFSDEWQGVPYYERTAKALRDAVRDLRGKKDTTLVMFGPGLAWL